MENNQNPQPKTDPLNPSTVETGSEVQKRILQAKCDEKEGKYESARDIFIDLTMTEDALRCSEKIGLSVNRWRKENKKPIWTLAIVSGIIIIVFIIALISLNNSQMRITPATVIWLNPGKVELTSYPSWFYYDKTGKLIKTRAVIDEKMKAELEKTYPWSSDSTNYSEFSQAVEKLAFQSAEMKGSYYWLLLLVSGLAAVVGVLIREILDLIRHYCYYKDLDFKTWWPWYVLRPFVGFMIGVIVVLFSGTDLLINSSNNNSETYLIAIAIIAGISVEDVMFRIRKVSQVLFGNNNQESGSAEGNKTAALNNQPEPESKQPKGNKGIPGEKEIKEN